MVEYFMSPMMGVKIRRIHPQPQGVTSLWCGLLPNCLWHSLLEKLNTWCQT